MTCPKSLIRIAIVSAAIAAFCSGCQHVEAQLISAVKTRRFEPAYQYSPSDPWTRSNATQVQTKHYGFFYNCDREECKRQSPYVQWKRHCETDLPPKKSCLTHIQCALDEIKQRLRDGGCLGEVGCSDGQAATAAAACQSCTCAATCKSCRAQGGAPDTPLIDVEYEISDDLWNEEAVNPNRIGQTVTQKSLLAVLRAKLPAGHETLTPSAPIQPTPGKHLVRSANASTKKSHLPVSPIPASPRVWKTCSDRRLPRDRTF